MMAAPLPMYEWIRVCAPNRLASEVSSPDLPKWNAGPARVRIDALIVNANPRRASVVSI